MRAAGGEVTIVRATWFSQNWSEAYWADYVRAGVVALPAGETPEPFIDVEDIADVATAALTDDRHIGRALRADRPAPPDVRGGDRGDRPRDRPRRSATSRSRSRTTPPRRREQGVPQEVIDLLTYLFSEVLDGRNAHLADGVQRALGREPRDFADYARETAAAGVWNAPVTRRLMDGLAHRAERRGRASAAL